jgi:rhomboid protease GluP
VLTRVLVAINVVVYLWERFIIGTDANGLAAHGGLVGTDVAAGQWWRIFTSGFMHGSDMHILFNMIALFQVGTFVEMIYGAPRMLFIYLLAMFGGGLAVTYFTPDVVTIGASGAIFGLFGALATAGFRLGAPGRQMMRQTIGIIVINIAISFWPGSNISVADHSGGLLVGTLSSFVLWRPRVRLVVEQQPQQQGTPYAHRIGPDPQAVTIEHGPLDEPSEHRPST